MSKSLKIHFVTSIPSPYQLDFFEALEAVIPGEFTVTFSAAQEIDRQYYEVPKEFGFSARILNHKIRKLGKDFHRNPALGGVLREFPARNVIVGGSYFMPDALTVRRHCMKTRQQLFFWGENPSKKRDGWLKHRLKRSYLRWFLRGVDGVIAVGQAAAGQYRRLGGRGLVTTSIPYAPNLDALLEPDETVLKLASEIRASNGVGSGVLVLYAGSLIDRKDPLTLVRSFADVVAKGHETRLLIAGEGPLRGETESLVQALNLNDRVTLAGYLRGEQLAATYHAADVFVLPTIGHEGWGVVVQEAMAAGLPVIASNRVGAAVDMLAEGNAGFLFDAGNRAQLAERMTNLIRNPEQRSASGRNARELARNTDARSAAARLLQFLDSHA